MLGLDGVILRGYPVFFCQILRLYPPSIPPSCPPSYPPSVTFPSHI